MIATVWFLKLLGFTFNQLTMLALSLSIGLLILAGIVLWRLFAARGTDLRLEPESRPTRDDKRADYADRGVVLHEVLQDLGLGREFR